MYKNKIDSDEQKILDKTKSKESVMFEDDRHETTK